MIVLQVESGYDRGLDLELHTGSNQILVEKQMVTIKTSLLD